MAEEVELVALQAAEFSGPVRDATQLVLPALSGLDASHAFKIGNAWTDGDADNDAVRCISAQLIWEREIEACQFSATGLATRHASKGGWGLVGRSRVRVPTMWTALQTTQACVSRFRLGRESFVEIEARTRAKMSGHTVLGTGQIDHLIDWQAVRPTGTRSIYTLKKYQPL